MSTSSQSSESTLDMSTFATGAINGTYTATGAYWNGSPVYNNGTYNLFYDDSYLLWAISSDVGDPPPQWVSSQDQGTSCPDGAYASESGLVSSGAC